MSAFPAHALAIAALVGLGGCAALLPRPMPPEVRLAEVRVIVFSFPRVRLAIDLELHNPNPADLAIAALDMAISIEGEPVAQAALAAPATLPAHRNASMALHASGHLGAALTGVARRLGQGGGPLRYELAGSVSLADGTTYPFRRSGVLAHL